MAKLTKKKPKPKPRPVIIDPLPPKTIGWHEVVRTLEAGLVVGVFFIGQFITADTITVLANKPGYAAAIGGIAAFAVKIVLLYLRSNTDPSAVLSRNPDAVVIDTKTGGIEP